MIFERRAGELWITTRWQSNLQVKLFEDDFRVVAVQRDESLPEVR